MEIEIQRENGVYWTGNHWGRLRRWMTGAIMTLSLTLFTTLTPAHAAVESVAPINLWCEYNRVCIHTTDTAAAQAFIATMNAQAKGILIWYLYGCNGDGLCIVQLIYNDGYTTGKTHFNVGFIPSCPAPSVNPSILYEYKHAKGICERTVPDCPANSSGTYPDACVCNTGYKVDAAQTSCVPIPDTCQIPDLTPLTDPVAIDFDNNVGSRWRPKGLTPDYQTKLKCVEDAIIARGGTSEGTSAYRPKQYQRHLYEIIKKDVELSKKYMKAHPECQARRKKITEKMRDHGLKYDQEIAMPGTSRHEDGTAFDLTPYDLTKAQLALIYKGCGVTNKAVKSELWHTQ